MIIRGFVIAATVIVSCQAYAQQAFIPQTIPQLQEALTTSRQRPEQLIEIPERLAREWIQVHDEPAWAAIQKGSLTKIDLKPLLGAHKLSDERLTDGIDPLAIYGANGDFSKIWIRGVGVNPSKFVDATFKEARKKGESAKVLAATEGDKPRSSLAQTFMEKLQNVGESICKMTVRPEQVSVSVGFFGTGVEATFGAAALCKWLSGGT